jgi:hypothetical protein
MSISPRERRQLLDETDWAAPRARSAAVLALAHESPRYPDKMFELVRLTSGRTAQALERKEGVQRPVDVSRHGRRDLRFEEGKGSRIGCFATPPRGPLPLGTLFATLITPHCCTNGWSCRPPR